jgi:hypothetical protein
MNFEKRLEKLLKERLEIDPHIAMQAKTADKVKETGYLGNTKFQGREADVTIKFDPTDPDIQGQYVYHTHPAKEPSPITALPSQEDLEVAVRNKEKGLIGIVVFSDKYYTAAVPTDRARERLDARKYLEFTRNGDLRNAIRELESLGFHVEIGQK